ncbi:MAG: glycoside hydrolase domain-containing protein [Planctomycetota bacterium]
MNMQATLRTYAGVLAIGIVAAVSVAAEATEDGFAVLSDESVWRYHAAWRTPATVRDGQYDHGGGYPIPDPGTRWILNSFTHPTPPPADGWTAVDFDDSCWSRETGPPVDGYGYESAKDISLVCARTRFGVTDPEKVGPLELKLTYRGGAVVYLNGKEIARKDLPAGEIEPMTLARDYRVEDVTDADGFPLRKTRRGELPRGADPNEYAKRFRTLTADVPAELLREGTNVLAVEVHRAALPAETDPLWGTAGVVDIALAAPTGAGLTPNPAPQPDVLVWNAGPLERIGPDAKRGDPLEPLRPVRLATPRNGVSSGQVVVSSSSDVGSLEATLSDLTSDNGATLDAQNVTIRYATLDRVPQLRDRPTGGAQTVPVHLTARVPTDAGAGVYRGTLTIRGIASPTEVPVNLTVYDWTLPDLADYGTSVSLLHCPESSMRVYDVGLWSDEHFALIEESMELMGYAGNTLLSLPLLGEDVFGDQPLIVFRKVDGQYMPDFRYARRYLELYDKHAAPPRFLSVQVWNYHVSARGFGRDGGKKKWVSDTIKVRELRDGKLVPIELPTYGRPGTEPTWRAVAEGVRNLVEEMGWTKTRLLWGTGGDNLPCAEEIAFFKKIAPDFQWRVVTHGGSIQNWDEDRVQAGGLVVGYANIVRRNYNRRRLWPEAPLDSLKRDGVTSCCTDYLTMAPLARIAANYSGTGYLSFDTWAWEGEDGRQRGPVRRYVPFGNIHTSGSPFVAPGPDGAAPSPQLESFREGLQVTEAILQLRQTLADPERDVPRAVADEARETIQTLMDQMESNRKIRPTGTADVWPTIRRIYELTARVSS